MTVLEQVRNLIIRRRGDPICDDCIAKELALSVRQHANIKTRELAMSPAFERRKLNCGRCGGDKLSIRLR